MKQRLSARTLKIGTTCALLLFVGILLSVLAPRSRSDTGPVLVGGPLSNGYFFVTITNAVPGTAYEIYEKTVLDTNIPWSGSVTGAPFVTNFSIFVGTSSRSWFFKAVATNDIDGDGIPNFKDADPTNPTNNAVLAITIVSPANGTTLH